VVRRGKDSDRRAGFYKKQESEKKGRGRKRKEGETRAHQKDVEKEGGDVRMSGTAIRKGGEGEEGMLEMPRQDSTDSRIKRKG